MKRPIENTPNSRREFARKITAGIAGAGLLGAASTTESAVPAPAKAKKNLLQHAGADYHVVMADPSMGWNEKQKYWTTKKNFEYHERCGVRHFTNIMSGVWNADDMKRWKDDCDKYGKVWEAIRMDSSYIFAKTRSDQEKKLADVADNIRKASAVGVKVVTMHWTLIPIRRNGHTDGRGGSSYHSFKLEDNWKDLPVEKHGVVKYDEYWERITYFLKNIIPVCARHDVRLGVHPYDPPGLPRGYQGVDTWDCAPTSVFDSLKKYESIVDSPYNGFQLCLGTVMEGLKNPKTELLPIVKYFAEKGKIYQIHMRNIKGGLGNFEEVYIDGEMNQERIIRVMLEEVHGVWQGACIPFIDKHGLRKGNNRLAFSPDGSLYVGQVQHGFVGDTGIQRIVFTGKDPVDIHSMNITEQGFDLHFTQPMDEATLRDTANYDLRHYYYEYHLRYGSDQFDVQKVGVKGIEVSDGRKTVSLQLGNLKPGYIYELTMGELKSEEGEVLENRLVCYTVNSLPSGRSGTPSLAY